MKLATRVFRRSAWIGASLVAAFVLICWLAAAHAPHLMGLGLAAALLAVGIAALGALVLYMYVRVLRPLVRLQADVADIALTPGARLNWTRVDELGVLAQAVDRLLDAQAREALDREESERTYRQFIENLAGSVPGIVHIYDCRAQCTAYVNAAVEPILGYTPSEIMAMPVSQATHLVDPSDLSRAQVVVARLAAESAGIWEDIDYRFQHKDGTWRWFRERIAVFARDVHGDVTQVIGIAFDVTEQRKADAERAAVEERQRQAQKLESLGIMAGGIAHDFNNLLVGMLGNADLALREAAVPPPVQVCLEAIRTSAERAATLTGQMLAYSGHGQLVAERVDVNVVLRDLKPLLDAAVERTAELILNLAPAGVPPIEGDPAQIRQLVLSLVTNAYEALPNGAGVVRLATRAVDVAPAFFADDYVKEPRPGGRYVEIEVADTGSGISADVLPQIFDPFFTTKFVGRGLGLSVVLGILRGHRGAIKVRSAPNHGSAFLAYLPALPPEDAAAVASATGTARVAEGSLILVVDDEPMVRMVAERMLVRAGHRVVTAVDGADGLEAYRARPREWSAVILDLSMPRLSGPELFRIVHQDRPDLPIFVMSGYDEHEVRRRLGDAQPVGFIRKPFDWNRLLGMIGGATPSPGAPPAAS